MYGTLLGFSSFVTCGFSKKPSVQKLWREKANMQMSSCRSRQVLARFEYRAYISRYILTGGSLSKRSLFSPLGTSRMLLWRVFAYQGRVRRYCSEPLLPFPRTEVLKLLKRRTVGQAVPEIPLSVGSKLELLLSLPNFRILPRTLTHLSAYA